MNDFGILEDDTLSPLLPCPVCGRTFRPDALARHERVCQKNKAKKRKVFDSSKQRSEGTEIKTVPKVSVSSTSKVPEKPKNKGNWRAKHEELIRNIRAARGADGQENSQENGNVSGNFKPHVPPDYVECPSCGRNFSERAADRHIAWCNEQKSRIPKSPASAEATERLKARTKYKVPLPGKKNASGGSSGDISNRRNPPVKKTKEKQSKPLGSQRTRSSPSMLETSGQEPVFQRKNNRNAGKNSVQQKSKGPKLVMKFKEKFPNHISNRNLEDSYDPYKQAELQLRDLLRSTTIVSKAPRTVPGVRTGGLNNNTGELKEQWSSTGALENNQDDEMNYLNMKLADLGRPGFTGEFTNNWAKRITDNGLPVVSNCDVPLVSHFPLNGRLHDSDPPLSSSSSEGSLPPLSRGGSSEGKLPRFCHQCGTKYPVSGAKYCCECGARRLGVLALYGQTT